MINLTKQKLKFAAVLGIATAAFYLTSCQEEGPVKSTKKNDVEKIKQLVTEMYTDADEAQIEKTLEKYRSLTTEEFELYQKLQLERDSLGLSELTASSSQRVDLDRAIPLSKETLGFEVKKLRTIRSFYNKEALKTYGKSFNQLAPEEMDKIYSKYESPNKLDKDASGLKTMACTDRSYPHRTPSNAGSGRGWMGHFFVERDCDHEFVFQGDFNRIKARNAAAQAVMLAHLNRTGRRHISGTTRIILGRNRVDNIIDSYVNLRVDMVRQ